MFWPYFDIFWTTTVQTQDNMESICFYSNKTANSANGDVIYASVSQ